MNRPRFEALTHAAETYEAERAAGALRGEAFEAALEFLKSDGRDVGKRGVAVSLPRVVRVPSEVAALVLALVRSRVGEDWERVFPDMTGGRRYPLVAGLRHEIGWVLHALAYSDKVIAKALGVDRTTVVSARRSFALKLKADDVLAARVARIVGGERAEARAA